MTPDPLRWSPLPEPAADTDFIDGLFTVAGNGGPAAQAGVGIHLYAANTSMRQRAFYNADAEMMIVPQHGALRLITELGVIEVEPQQIAVIPRGVRFRVELQGAVARGYVLENFGAFLRLPDLGPIGSNGLANPRDFEYPVAAFEDLDDAYELIAKFQGHLWRADMDHSPFDVVAWHGSYAPYRYDLRRFNTIGSISYDHPDPSIFLVLYSPSDTPGTSNVDFAIFPPRWLVRGFIATWRASSWGWCMAFMTPRPKGFCREAHPYTTVSPRTDRMRQPSRRPSPLICLSRMSSPIPWRSCSKHAP